MEKLMNICEYSHDCDGFDFEEDDCSCAICKGNGKYYLCHDMISKSETDDVPIN